MEKWTKKRTGCSFVFRLKLGSISSAKKNLADEITLITWNYLQNLEIISYPNSYHDLQAFRAKCRKFDPATGVRGWNPYDLFTHQLVSITHSPRHQRFYAAHTVLGLPKAAHASRAAGPAALSEPCPSSRGRDVQAERRKEGSSFAPCPCCKKSTFC